MSNKKSWPRVLITAVLLLAVGVGSTHALPQAKEPDAPGETISGPGRPAEEALPLLQGFKAVGGSKPIGRVFAISNQTVDAIHSAVAYNGNRQEYLVVWQNDRAVWDDIQAQRVSKDGALVGNAFYVSAGTGASRGSPDVAYNGTQNEYLVVWDQVDGAGVFDIHAQRVSATGGVVGSEVTIATGSATVGHAWAAVAYASTSDKYLVVWGRQTGTNFDIMGQVLSSMGALEGGNFVISQDPGAEPRMFADVAYNRSRNEYLVVWQTCNAQCDIYGRRVQGDGTPMPPESINIGVFPDDQEVPAVGAIPTPPSQGWYLVAWEDRAPGDVDIWARLVAGDGTLGSVFGISQSSADEFTPAVAGSENGQRYLVVWMQEYTGLTDTSIRGRAVSIGGNLLGDEALLSNVSSSDFPAVASGRFGDFLVTFDDQPGSTTTRDIYGRLWGIRAYLPLIVK